MRAIKPNYRESPFIPSSHIYSLRLLIVPLILEILGMRASFHWLIAESIGRKGIGGNIRDRPQFLLPRTPYTTSTLIASASSSFILETI